MIAEGKDFSWFDVYKKCCKITVRIVTVFRRGQNARIHEDYSICVNPHMRVATFLSLFRLRRDLVRPHDPSHIGGCVAFTFVADDPDGKPNCTFSMEDETVSISEAGLVDGAILEQNVVIRMDCDCFYLLSLCDGLGCCRTDVESRCEISPPDTME